MAGGNVPANLAPIFQQASQQYGIPAHVLAGVASVESSLGQDRSTSSAGAVGLMQFLPSTAQSIGINPLDDKQAILGAAKLLNQYGYQQNPLRALGAYNGGPGNPQYSYANQVMSEANRLAPQLKGGPGGGSIAQPGAQPASVTLPGLPSQTVPGVSTSFDSKGYQNALNAYSAIRGLQASAKNDPYYMPVKGERKTADPVLSLLGHSNPFPQASSYIKAQTSLQQLAGTTPLTVHPAVQAASPGNPHFAGGFLPAGAKYVQGRRDQGRDGQTTPGGPIVSPGSGHVVSVPSDPSGFGPRYPLVHFDSGPYAGRTIYFGHTLSAVHPGQQIKPGQVISYTGTAPVGNASVPGWFEIGFADSGSPGPLGQPIPF